jgi:hypothetical protein
MSSVNCGICISFGQNSANAAISKPAKLQITPFVAAAAALAEMSFRHPIEGENPCFIGGKAGFAAAQRQSVPSVGGD